MVVERGLVLRFRLATSLPRVQAQDGGQTSREFFAGLRSQSAAQARRILGDAPTPPTVHSTGATGSYLAWWHATQAARLTSIIRLPSP